MSNKQQNDDFDRGSVLCLMAIHILYYVDQCPRRQLNQISNLTARVRVWNKEESRGERSHSVFSELLLVIAWRSCWSGTLWTSSAKIQMKGLKLVQYLNTPAHSGEGGTCQQASLTCKWSRRLCIWGCVPCYSCHVGNPMDTYRAHRTCGSWPTYTRIRQATERKDRAKGKGRQQERRKKMSTSHWCSGFLSFEHTRIHICIQMTVSRGRFQCGIDGRAAGKFTVSDTGSHVAGHAKYPHTHMHGWVLWRGRTEEFLNARAHAQTRTCIHHSHV